MIIGPNGPARYWPKSMRRTPSSASVIVPAPSRISALCWPGVGCGPWIAVGVPNMCSGVPICVVSPTTGSTTVCTMPFAISCGCANCSSGVMIASIAWLFSWNAATISSRFHSLNFSRRFALNASRSSGGSAMNVNGSGASSRPQDLVLRSSSAVSPLMTDTCTQPSAHSKIICWWMPGGYDLPISSCVPAFAFSRCCQIWVV